MEFDWAGSTHKSPFPALFRVPNFRHSFIGSRPTCRAAGMAKIGTNLPVPPPAANGSYGPNLPFDGPIPLSRRGADEPHLTQNSTGTDSSISSGRSAGISGSGSARRYGSRHPHARPPDLARKLVRTAHACKILVVLTLAEMKRLLGTTTCLKHQTALSVAYGAGLRVAEVSALTTGRLAATCRKARFAA